MVFCRFSAFFIVTLVVLPRSSAFWLSSHRFSILRLSPSLAKGQNTRSFMALWYLNSTTAADDGVQASKGTHRFLRQAVHTSEIDEDCLLTIQGNQYNMTGWAKAHPGGSRILQKFHKQDATVAFEKAHHSTAAYAMLKDFLVEPELSTVHAAETEKADTATNRSRPGFVPDVTYRWRLSQLRQKLFTREDPMGIHKYLGIFCLLNFIGRHYQMLFGDPAAGLGTKGHPWFAIACLIPHLLLSLSSLIFETVPKERVVGKPMIWQEFRVHNILFGARSVLSSLAAALAIKAGNGPKVRLAAIAFCGACVLGANFGADIATAKLRTEENQSTTATMPYWEKCSIPTQLRFKGFYAYCQFMATLACLAVGNPAWGLSTLLAIQLASLLMTLVRKGLLSAKGYHYGYTFCLLVPWLVGIRSWLFTMTPEFPLLTMLGYLMYNLRQRGASKYSLWIPVILARVLIGDRFITYAAW